MNTHQFYIMAVPALIALIGGILAALWQPSRHTRSLIQHFAAGVVLAALAVELLPEIGREHAPGWVIAGCFALGSIFMYGLKLWTDHLEHAAAQSTKEGLQWGLLLATFIDVATDGFIIGAGFAAGGETGTILALGLSVELLFLGMALSSDALRGSRIIIASGLLGATVLVFAVLGNQLLAGASKAVIGGALAFSAAALLYLVTEELLIEAHEDLESEKSFSTLILFAGFLTFWCIQLMGAE